MRKDGIVIFAPEDGSVVVKHDAGFTLVEIIEDQTGIGYGAELQARTWEGLGTDTLHRGNVAYQAMFWGAYERRDTAMRKALQFVTKQD